MNVQYSHLNKTNYKSEIDIHRICFDDPMAISYHRLHAHLYNPNLGDHDTFLIVASLDNKTLGYIGVFIDQINLQGKPTKIGWLSTWYIDPSSGGSGIGRELFNRMYNEYEGKIGISQFTESAKRVYDKSGYFQNLSELKGYKYEIRMNLNYYASIKYPKKHGLISVLKFIDNTVNLICDSWLSYYAGSLRKNIDDLRIDYLQAIDDETEQFIQTSSQYDFCIRDKAFFEYLKGHQWVQESPLIESTNSEKYFFSSNSRRFNFYLIKIKSSKNEVLGFLVLQIKDHVLKVLQVYHTGSAKSIAEIIISHAIQCQATTILCYNDSVNEHIHSHKFSYLRIKEKTRESIISKEFGPIPEAVNFQYGDGDCSFA